MSLNIVSLPLSAAGFAAQLAYCLVAVPLVLLAQSVADLTRPLPQQRFTIEDENGVLVLTPVQS